MNPPPPRRERLPSGAVSKAELVITEVEDVTFFDLLRLDAIAAAVAAETVALGEPPHPDGFRGHLTLARQRGGGVTSLDGASIDGSFRVDEIELLRSELHADGARYATVTRRRLST